MVVRQIDQVREVPVTIDAGEGVTAPLGVNRKHGALRFRGKDEGRLTPCGIVVRRAPLGLPDRLSGPCFVDHLGDPNAVVRKDLRTADGRDVMMVGMSAPRRQSPLVLPYLIGQQQVFPCQTLEAIDEEAATHGIELGLQRSGETQILIPVPGPCLNFKEQANHRSTLARARPAYPLEPPLSTVTRTPA